MFQKSKCHGGWLHSFTITDTYPEGVAEVCLKCRKRVYFPNNIPNVVYLSYHMRQALQRDHPLFAREYNK